MRHFRIVLVAAVAVGLFLLQPASQSFATPAGIPIYSVSTIGPAHDITPAPNADGDTCTSADILWQPAFVEPCAARVAPAPAGPVPFPLTNAPVDLGLNTAGVFTDDLDALSLGEVAGTRSITDYDFSVDPASAGAPVAPACPPAPPNVTTEAALLEAHGDIFTTLGVPAGCNQVAPSCLFGPCDEATLGLIAPAPVPGMPPLDDVDAIADWRGSEDPGGCTAAELFTLPCGAMSLTAGSATLGLAPADTLTGLAPDAATILVPPGTPANPPNLAAGCPAGGTACAAVHSSSLGLAAGDDLDALCWFDRNGDTTVDLPTTIAPATGDTFMFSLAPGSPTLAGLGYSAADILAPSPGGPVVSVAAAALGLLAADNIDGLSCHLVTTDRDGDGYTDVAENGAPFCAGAASEDGFEDAAANDGCPAQGAAEVACADAIDSDADTLVNDGCPVVLAFSEAPQCNTPGDNDGDGALNDGCPARGTAEAVCGPFGDEDLDGIHNDGCPTVGPTPELANNTMTRQNARCEAAATPQSSAWPADVNASPLSFNLVNLLDLGSFFAPVTRFNTSPVDLGFSGRWDLVPGPPTPSDFWISLPDLGALLAGATATPPMLLGAAVFGGPACTVP